LGWGSGGGREADGRLNRALNHYAASSASAGPQLVRASMQTALGIVVEGAFRWLLPVDGSDRLVFHPDVVNGLDDPVDLVLFTRGNRRFEIRARLMTGADVILADGAAVSHLDVERLEVHLP
jgi:hypothetical protein